jgi:hypothetical protein
LLLAATMPLMTMPLMTMPLMRTPVVTGTLLPESDVGGRTYQPRTSGPQPRCTERVGIA